MRSTADSSMRIVFFDIRTMNNACFLKLNSLSPMVKSTCRVIKKKLFTKIGQCCSRASLTGMSVPLAGRSCIQLFHRCNHFSLLLFIAPLMCCFQFSRLSRVIPRYFTVSQCFIEVLSRVRR